MKKEIVIKKMTAFVMVIVLMMMFIPSVFAEARTMTMTLSSPTTEIKPGEEFTVSANVTKDSNLGALDYVVNYNKDELEVVKTAPGTAFKKWRDRLDEEGKGSPTLVVNSNIPGEINLAIASTEAMSEEGELLKITFKAKDKAISGNGGITQTITNCEQPKGAGKITSEPAVGVEDKSFEDKIVVNPDIASVSLKTAPTKTSYIKAQEAFDPTGGVIMAKYTNNATQDFNLTAEMCSNYNLDKVGKYTVDVTYKGKKVDKGFDITVADKTAVSAVFTPPTSDQTSYLEGKKDQ
ncbi:MAG: cohesin domain-containing protein, partial [Eubacterium sp.]